MSKKVTFNIIRDDNESLLLDGEEWGITGLENWANLSHELSVTENANYDGGIITNSRIASIDRTIEARLKDARLNELMRERILSFFNPKHEYEVHVEYQGMKRYCKGVQYGFSCDNGNVYQPITFSWTILCTQPYMLSEDDFGKDIANIDGAFGFPFVSCLQDGTQQSKYLGSGGVLTVEGNGEQLSGVSLYPRDTVSELTVGVAGKNLWINPSGTNDGITATSNEDGTIALSGTASSRTVIRTSSYSLVPGRSYIISVDKQISPSYSYANATGAAIGVEFYNSDTWLQSIVFGYGTTLSSLVVVPDSTSISYFEIVINAGETLSGTYRIMLNEGETADPWEKPQTTTKAIDLKGNTLNAGDSVSITNGKAILSSGNKQIDLGSVELPSLLTGTTNIWSNVGFDTYIPTGVTQPTGYLTGFIAGAYSFSNVVDIVNDGDVETYLRVVINANGSVTNPAIHKDGKYVKILGTLKQDDVVEIDFNQRPPSVTKNGENIINLSDRTSSFTGMQLDVGINQISYGADDGENNMSVSVYFEKRYLGI